MPTDQTIDAVQLMREIREQMSREMEGMSKEEILRFLNEGVKPEHTSTPEAKRHHAA